jgi:hypothetical protein
MVEQHLIAVKDENATGFDTIPINSLILVKSTGDIYNITNLSGITHTTPLWNITNKLLVMSNYSKNKGMFFGGTDAAISQRYNKVTIINTNGVLALTETNVGTGRYGVDGGNVGVNALFYMGNNTVNSDSKYVTIVSPTGVLVQAETNSYGYYNKETGAGDSLNGMYALFYGGGFAGTNFNNVGIFNSSGTLAIAETSVGTARQNLAGSTNGNNVLFYGGYIFSTHTYSNLTTLINSSGTLAKIETNVSTGKQSLGGARANINSLFYGGADAVNSTVTILNIFDTNVTLLNSITFSNSVYRAYLAGGSTDVGAIFYGGTNGTLLNTSTVINSFGTLLGAETIVGTARFLLGGSGI